MKRWLVAVVTVMGLAGGSQAYAQETTPGAGAVVVTVIPGGATFFTEGKTTKAPSFGNYGAGAGVEVHVNRFISFEGDVTSAIGVTQDLKFVTGTSNLRTPNMLDYSGTLVVSAANRSSVVPYVAGGVGGLTLFDESTLGVNENTTFLTGNVGGGVKWFNSKGRWGARADYRFLAVRSKDTAPDFFGQETRYGHRVYGGVLINVSR